MYAQFEKKIRYTCIKKKVISSLKHKEKQPKNLNH